MAKQSSFHRAFIGLVVLVTIFISVAAQMAQACPEIVIDPKTGVAVSQPDLKAALAEIDGRIAMADIR